jgi:hypothetical protein
MSASLPATGRIVGVRLSDRGGRPPILTQEEENTSIGMSLINGASSTKITPFHIDTFGALV